MNYTTFLALLMIGLTGCQAIAGDDVSVTLSSEMTAFATELAMIQQIAQIEQTHIIETVQASGTRVAGTSNVNRVLASTVQANVAPTLVMREVIVNPDDMGSSRDIVMTEDENNDTLSTEMQVINSGIARSVRANDGCTNGNVTQFTDNDDRIYFTAQISSLSNGTNFSVDWLFEDRLIYRSVWIADYSTGSECIWFYMTQDDAPFLLGLYTVTLYVNGNSLPAQQFSIGAG